MKQPGRLSVWAGYFIPKNIWLYPNNRPDLQRSVSTIEYNYSPATSPVFQQSHSVVTDRLVRNGSTYDNTNHNKLPAHRESTSSSQSLT